MKREDFPILNGKLIYFDSGATALKPKILADYTNEYYLKYSANIHRGIYDISVIADTLYDEARYKIAKFINAKNEKEIVFTSGSTDSLNKIIFGYFGYILKPEDEVVLTKGEHASNIIPWFELSRKIGFKIVYAELDKYHRLTIDSIKKAISNKTKVISIAHITNVIGDARPIKEICKIAHENNILVIVDGAQSVAHMKTDVEDLDVDFLVFSAHKMCGPTGLGILYAKEKHMRNIFPITFGGGMNESFTEDGTCIYKDIPDILEGGTPNIAGVIAFSKVIDYLEEVGMENISRYEHDLKKYAIEKLKKLNDIIIYNEFSESGIITINHKNLSATDLASYLNIYNICVRSGSHCAKMLDSILKLPETCRISLYFYNNKEEIDYLVEILKKIKTE